uniref:Cystathionine beta-synthase n=2 Tax=Lygus hesperus TaxID=30085 RepID=A0A146LAC7_LYGHE
MDHDIDYIFVATGTGGTITGVAQKIKEMIPKCKVIGVDPYGSLLAESDPKLGKESERKVFSYQVEGIGYDFVPDVLKYSNIDDWVKVNDLESFSTARKLISSEGLLCGGSSGSCVAGAIQYCKKHKIGKGKRVVVILPDSLRNYLSKFLDSDWLTVFHHQLNTKYDKFPWSKQPVCMYRDLYIDSNTQSNNWYCDASTDVAIYLKHYSDNDATFITQDCVPTNAHTGVCVRADSVIGVVHTNEIYQQLSTNRIHRNDCVQRSMRKAYVLHSSTTLGYLATLFKYEAVVAIAEDAVVVGILSHRTFFRKLAALNL